MQIGFGLGLNRRGFVSGGGGGGGEVTANEATQGNVTFPFSGTARVVGNSFDGSAFIVVPDGGTVTMTDPTPAVTTVTVADGTFATNGVAINPTQWLNDDPSRLPFDQRMAYEATNLATFPATLNIGDIVVKAIGHPTVTNANRRSGVIQEYAVCHIVSETQYNSMQADGGVSTWLAPAPFGWTGRTTKDWRKVDMNAVFSLRPGLSLSGISAPADMADNLTRLNRFNIGIIAARATSPGGYEAHSLYRYGKGSGAEENYGPTVGEAYGAVDMQFLGDTSRATIEPVIRRRVALGSWWFDIEDGRGTGMPADGAHHQIHLSNMLYGLIATGRSARIAEISSVSPQNQLASSFLFDSARLARLAPHDVTTEPFAYRRRPVTAVAGSSITVQLGLGGEPPWKRFYALEVRRASDDALVAYVSGNNGTASTTSYTLTLDRDVSAALTTSDQVYFAAPSDWFSVGDAGWSLTANFATYTPSPTAEYYPLQFWARDCLLVRGLGFYSSQFEAMEKLVKRSVYDPDLPSLMIGSGGSVRLPDMFSTNPLTTTRTNYGQFVKDFWNAHADTLGLGETPSTGTVTLAAASYPNGASGPFVAPYLGSTGRSYGVVPLSGTGTPGAIIQARAYDDEFAGANTTAWQTIATVAGDGTWSANWNCPLTLFWALPEVRVLGLDATIQRGASRFAVGLVADLKGQSEIINGFDTAYISTAQRPTVTAPGNVFISRFGDGEEAGAWVTETGYAFSGGLPAFIANYIQERFPGLKARLGYDARGGTGPDQALDDDNPLRNWSDTVAVWNATTYSGYIKPSVLALHWFVNTEVYGANYGRLWAEILTQKRANGTPFTLPAALETTYEAGGTVTVEHTYAELYDDDYANTKVMCGSFASAHGFYANHPVQRQAFIDARANLPHFAAIVEDADFSTILPHSRGTAANGDLAHPSFSSVAGQDGAARFHRSLLDGVIRCAGLVTTYSNPVFTNFEVAADGSYADLWSASYPVNSIWGIRGETIPTGARPAIGIAVNKARPANAEYVSGRLRVYPASGQTFDGYTIFSIDETAANMSSREVGGTEIGYQYWKGFPIVPAAEIPGATALEGVPIDLNKTKTLYPNLLVNNLAPPAAPILVNQATGDGQLFRSGVLPATGRHLIFGARFNTAATVNGARVYDIGADGCTCFVQGASGLMRVTLRSGTTVIFQADYAITRGTVLNHIVTVDAPNRTVKVYELTGDELIGSVTPITPTTTLTAWTASVFVLRGGELRMFDQSGGGRSLEASSLGQVVVAMTSATSDLAKFIDLGGTNEAADVMALSQRMKNGGISPAYATRAQVVIGDDTAVASWNAGTMNDGTAPNSGWTRSGTFA